MALQEAAEAYLVSLFEDTNLAAIHAKRVTMYVLSTLLHHCAHAYCYLYSIVNRRTLLSRGVSGARGLECTLYTGYILSETSHGRLPCSSSSQAGILLLIVRLSLPFRLLRRLRLFPSLSLCIMYYCSSALIDLSPDRACSYMTPSMLPPIFLVVCSDSDLERVYGIRYDYGCEGIHVVFLRVSMRSSRR